MEVDGPPIEAFAVLECSRRSREDLGRLHPILRHHHPRGMRIVVVTHQNAFSLPVTHDTTIRRNVATMTFQGAALP